MSILPDTWLVGGPDLMAMSGSVESDRVIQLHFRRPATDQDRKWLLEAINAKIAADKGWQCHAKLRPEAAGCMWPDCGCEPRATEVIAELVKQGWSAPVSKPGDAGCGQAVIEPWRDQ